MPLRSLCLSLSLTVVVLNLSACSSSTPLKKTNDAAVASDLGAEVATARDASLEVAGPDVAGADLPLPDASLVAQDTVDLLPIKDAPQSDLLPIKDVFTTELAIFSLDAPWTDGPVVDVPSAEAVATTDLVSRDGATDRPLPCASGGDHNCNDNPIVSSTWGTCQPDGTCACTAGHVVNPSTGRCMMAPISDASAGSDTSQAFCTGDYTACGCGCCGGVEATPSCYYPSLGETTTALMEQDLALKNATDCNLAGCSSGTHYICCTEPAPVSPSSATYTADGYSGGLEHVTIAKSGSDCATLSFAQPLSGSSSNLRISMPSSWGVSSAGFGACADRDGGVIDQAQGALGTLAFRASGSQCLADLHAALFAFASDGTVKTSRLDVDGIVVTGFPAGMCQ